MNIYLQGFLCNLYFHFSWINPRNGIAEPFYKKLLNCFRTDYIILHSYQQWMNFSCFTSSSELGIVSLIFFFLTLGLFIYLFIHLWLCWVFISCARAFSSCGKWGPLFIAVRGPLIIAASLVAEHRLQMHRLSNCGSRAQLLRGMWDLPRPGLEPVSPASAGRLSTTAPPEKPLSVLF